MRASNKPKIPLTQFRPMGPPYAKLGVRVYDAIVRTANGFMIGEDLLAKPGNDMIFVMYTYSRKSTRATYPLYFLYDGKWWLPFNNSNLYQIQYNHNRLPLQFYNDVKRAGPHPTAIREAIAYWLQEHGYK